LSKISKKLQRVNFTLTSKTANLICMSSQKKRRKQTFDKNGT